MPDWLVILLRFVGPFVIMFIVLVISTYREQLLDWVKTHIWVPIILILLISVGVVYIGNNTFFFTNPKTYSVGGVHVRDVLASCCPESLEYEDDLTCEKDGNSLEYSALSPTRASLDTLKQFFVSNGFSENQRFSADNDVYRFRASTPSGKRSLEIWAEAYEESPGNYSYVFLTITLNPNS